MAQASEGTAEAAAGATGGVSHLPWQQVPKFTPGVTSVDEYSQRLRFLKELWPAEHLSLLAPRAALLVEGAAFQKVSRIKPEQLRGPDGVKYLVESLGGSWGKTTVEERYHFFEQAIFQTQQKADESNDSYIARHDAFFEELLSRGVTLEEIRAYVLLRHSLLAPEDKKRVIVEAKGDLKYQETVRAVRLLGSKFFTDFQNRSGPGNAKAMDRSKVYDIHMTTDDDTFEEVHMAMGQDEDLSDELILAHFLEANDEDAIYITEFEDQIVEAVQESELAPVFASYQEARQKLRDKAKSRGFWPIKGKMKGKGQSGKRGKGYGSWDGGRRRSLADRIANSNCKQCGAKGHWKRECPKNDAKPEATLFAQIQPTDPFQSEVLQTLPDSEPFNIDEDDSAWTQRGVSTGTGNTGVIQDFGETCFMVAPKAQGPATAPKQAVLRRSKPSLSIVNLSDLLHVGDRNHRTQHGSLSSSRQHESSNILLLRRAASNRAMPTSVKQSVKKLQEKMPEVNLDEPLSAEEDVHLAEEQLTMVKYLEVEVVRPPGIANLREWGQVVIAAGKHKGKSHEKTFETDLSYSILMARKSSLSSPWALSFKNYALMRLKQMAKTEQARSTTKAEAKNIKSQGPAVMDGEESDGWKLCSPDATSHTAAPSRGSKRNSPPGASSQMPIAMSPEEIMTRRAVLERELTRLREIEDADKDSFFLTFIATKQNEVQQGTLRMIHELEVGDTPPGNNHLRKATTLYTTSRRLQQSVDTRFQTAGPDPSGRSNRMFPRERRLAKRVALHLGTNRIQPPCVEGMPRDMPLRQTVVVKRVGGEIAMDGEIEDWSQDGPLIQGYPPRSVPRHGPGYFALGESEKRELVRLHNNLGHPCTETFVRFLQERKAEPALIQGARDYSCSTCLETVPTQKLARPATIHTHRDFNDTIGMDVAYWTNSGGKKFLFTHIVDEGTLFQQASGVGRTPEEQWEFLSDHWFQWAGPCQTLYVDPAGEYNSDYWRLKLQTVGVCTNVSAGEAHWQLGRTEAHGRILKSMLSKMDHEEPILNDEGFRRCLRAAVQAKNSLSRVRGFTPEQAVLGKLSRLPASLISDNSATCHALADSDLPEGVSFRRDLQRREQARVAFIHADNDNSYRRALLRRSRHPCERYEPGDWVLYWRRHKAGSRAEQGRWYGPGQVICGDSKVVWVSHCGQLIRAAPEQLRSASLREWQGVLGKTSAESSQGAVGQGVRRVVDLAVLGGTPSRAEVESQGEVPQDVPEPLGPIAPEGVAGIEAGGTVPEVPEENAEGEQPEMEVSPVPSVGLETDMVDASNIPVPEDDEDDLLFGDSECFFAHPTQSQAWEISLHETEVPFENLPTPQQALHFVMLATEARKKRVEVRLRDLNEGERQQFVEAKGKEIRAWLDHRTVRKVAAGTLDDSQLMRCRWLLTWKGPEKDGGPKRAKARLVVLGFEDPDIADIPNDAPTLGKDARQLILQKVASNRWKLINFDVSTAFLQGEGDGRKLGIRPPEELRRALNMQAQEQCQLEGGAYGRIDAPFLWFQTFKKTLEELGFVQSPFDACAFSLVSQRADGSAQVHGVLGIHVDDGIGGGDEYFRRVIDRLRGIYSFGSYDEGEFTFTGIRFRQWDDGSIEMDQERYIEKIVPIHVSRERRVNPTAMLNPEELKELRRLNGSLQYAAVHSRPDLAAKVGYLQTRVNKGQVQHLLEANRVLQEAKAHPISLMVVPIQEQHVTFCTFSDASFATSKDHNSYQGTLVVATDWRMLANREAVIIPVAWSSKKISRVVRSTLSAEVVSLCGSVDRMSWIRLFWEWFKNPAVDIAHPEEVLSHAPQASLVTDCKSAYDIATKTAVPTCSELRTQLECLLLRERLQENCKMRWVHSKAMLADCLTKVMDSSELRRHLREGYYALFDEQKVLENRAGQRQSLQWLRQNSTGVSPEHK
ncbi:RE1 [Symbiodinium natans]|uniref:RE1 protein n=1 Tax=Symbiodinium natans TaxID=878477 RepID=A0A812MC28_9DINO|nr:RE1 [Symbiodinium natans]